MTTHFTGHTISHPSPRRTGLLAAALGVVIVALAAIAVADWRSNGGTGDVPTAVTAPATGVSSDGSPPLGGMAELYREQATASQGRVDTMGGMGELYQAQQAGAQELNDTRGWSDVYPERDAFPREAAPSRCGLDLQTPAC